MTKKAENLNTPPKPSLDIAGVSGSTFDDKYLANNIVEARTNHDKACEVYRNYVGKAETREERLRRINAFRCGGW